jgi:hypothetical protein
VIGDEVFDEELGVALDGGEQVVEVVGDAAVSVLALLRALDPTHGPWDGRTDTKCLWRNRRPSCSSKILKSDRICPHYVQTGPTVTDDAFIGRKDEESAHPA